MFDPDDDIREGLAAFTARRLADASATSWSTIRPTATRSPHAWCATGT